jgi:hypothetical protein
VSQLEKMGDVLRPRCQTALIASKLSKTSSAKQAQQNKLSKTSLR